MENYDDLIGLSVADAAAARVGTVIRVVKQDGTLWPITADFNMDRINVEVEDGIITVVTGRG